MQNEGTRISSFFQGFPENKKVDACYERDRHGSVMSPIVLISGNKYYLFDQTEIYPGYPKRLNKMFPNFQRGFRVKLAFKFDDYSYIFGEDSLIYKYREEDRSLSYGFPMRIGDWFDNLRFVKRSKVERVNSHKTKDLFKNLQASYINQTDLYIFQGLQVFKMPINRRRHVPKLYQNNFLIKYCGISVKPEKKENILADSYSKDIRITHKNSIEHNQLTFRQFLKNVFSDAKRLEFEKIVITIITIILLIN